MTVSGMLGNPWRMKAASLAHEVVSMITLLGSLECFGVATDSNDEAMKSQNGAHTSSRHATTMPQDKETNNETGKTQNEGLTHYRNEKTQAPLHLHGFLDHNETGAWDATRFKKVRALMDAPRNFGCVYLMMDTLTHQLLL